MKTEQVDLIVIGAGSGGLSVAAAASQMGLQVALCEAGKMGGDCLNYGCVPSKSLLAAAKRAQVMRDVATFGIKPVDPSIDYKSVQQHIQLVIDTIAPHDSEERFTGLGVKVFRAAARFLDKNTIQVNDTTIKAKKIVIATGSSPMIPNIVGLQSTPYLTNETIFTVASKPQHLVIIGGGPIGCEMAQAHLMLGIKVSMIVRSQILPKDDLQCVQVAHEKLLAQGLNLYEQAQTQKVASTIKGIQVAFSQNSHKHIIEGTHLLVATGRTPNLSSLDLDKAGIKYNKRGIIVDKRLRTAQKNIYAIGDVIGQYQFTHAANYHAGIVIRNALFRLPAKVNYQAMPWVTYMQPELAKVGLTERQAEQQRVSHRVLRMKFSDIDRAVAEHETEGLIKIIVTPKGKILGATIIGAHAGELIQPWVLAINNGLKVSAMASMVVPYPALNDINKRVAGSFYTDKLYSSRMQKIIRFLY
jgi:pyruvate/2-oxoglutarate dehydrogenase complex dihydrolipoamide dehydrogenase (E3) component